MTGQTALQSDPRTALEVFHECTRTWFGDMFESPTRVQQLAWPVLASTQNGLLLAPTGSGKTLAAFLAAIDRVMFGSEKWGIRDAESASGVRVLYISPLKALGVDVDRNLRAPIAGLRSTADRLGFSYHHPTVAVRSGDTTSQERASISRRPPDILITTPESLYLILTSKAREILRSVETVIIDEIHAMVPTKRGVHLFLSLERLERLRNQRDGDVVQPLQRIGLSATQRPLSEVARLLGGAEATADASRPPIPRSVNIIDASEPKRLDLRVEVPVEDMARLAEPAVIPTGNAASSPALPSIWPSIHPRLVELIRAHRSTMIFVNSRRLAERLAAAINELADEEIALAHHGSVAKDTRAIIEDRLKRGTLPAIVATSSLELGIDMGAVDLVIQIEAPPSIASGMQRIGRAGHQIGVPSNGVIFPKYRGDLLACSAATARMLKGEVEESVYPRNPLDVLAQQIVAIVAGETISVADMYRLVRSAAPFADLPQSSFEGVLDLLSGRYPSDEFSELRPRINWDRVAGMLSGRRGSQRLAVLNAGTIPDRGLYGVFLVGEGGASGSRVGELDEEMVFETKAGEIFLLGASSWRVLEITRDRVIVAPAPGQPGRMPFWRGDGPGRPLEFGRAIGQLSRELVRMDREAAEQKLVEHHALDHRAATNLVNYLQDQAEATGEPPSDRTIVVESFLDEIGDWRVVILTPFGARVHAPWAMAVSKTLQDQSNGEVDMMWTDDGIVFRLPLSDQPPQRSALFPSSGEIEDLVLAELGSTAMFAGHFRENAARALLLPRRQPTRRTPLWLQRRRSADLLSVAAKWQSFPMLLETYRECLRDVFDLSGLTQILKDVEKRLIRVVEVRTDAPSPFAASLLFTYTGNFLYNGDAPLAERRAMALSLDHAQLRELLGSADFRELFDADTIAELELQLQRLTGWTCRDEDDLHDLLLQIGDLTIDEIALRLRGGDLRSGGAPGQETRAQPQAGQETRAQPQAGQETRAQPQAGQEIGAQPQEVDDRTATMLASLAQNRRIIDVRIVGEERIAAAEDSARFRDVLGIVPPPGLPQAFLAAVEHPLQDLIARYARTHGPFTAEAVHQRLGIATPTVVSTLLKLAEQGRVVEGEFRPGGCDREWCDAGVLRRLKRVALAKLREQVEPVDAEVLARFIPEWQHVTRPKRGLDGVLDVIEQFQGVPLAASVLENEVLPARVQGFQTTDLDELFNAGEIVWRGFESVGSDDGRIGVYLADDYEKLAPPIDAVDNPLAEQLVDLLQRQGATFFEHIAGLIGGFRNDLLDALWELVWAGRVTNDTLTPLRSLRRAAGNRREGRGPDGRRERYRGRGFRSRRRSYLPGSEGRWALLPDASQAELTPTARLTALCTQLVERYGILTRDTLSRENVAGGFSALYPVLKAMEEAGRVRRGYFVAGLGGAQFAAPGAEDRLRSLRDTDTEETSVVVLAATDPANAWGSVLPWPEVTSVDAQKPQRKSGAKVILQDGRLIAWLNPARHHVTTFLPGTQPQRDEALACIAGALQSLGKGGRALLISKVDGNAVSQSPLGQALTDLGFIPGSKGFVYRHRTTQ